jgi:predicted nucleic acid-binding protein
VIVIDASALVELLLRTEKADAVADLAFSTDEPLHAPELLDIEVAQALRRLVRLKQITASRASDALADHAQYAIQRYPHSPLLDRIWELRDTVTAYDAAYVALAEVTDAPLVTCDGKLAGAPGHRAQVVLI